MDPLSPLLKNTVLLVRHAHINPQRGVDPGAPPLALTLRHAGPLTDYSWALASWAGYWLVVGSHWPREAVMRCWHTHTAPGKDFRVMQHTHGSDYSRAYLQSPLQCGTLSALLWHTRSHLGCFSCALRLRSRGQARDYCTHPRRGTPCTLPKMHSDISLCRRNWNIRAT